MQQDVFRRERTVLENVRQALSSQGLAESRPGGFGPYLNDMADEYERLLRHTRRMAGLGDRMQRTLNELNHRLAASEQRYRSIFENVVEGIFRAEGEGPDALLVEANPALARMLGYSAPGELLRGEVRVGGLFANGQECSQFGHLLTKDGAVHGFQAELLRGDGGWFWAQLSASRISDANETGASWSLVGVITDVSERRRMMEEIYRLARTDSLTGLWNRGFFMDLGRRELARCRREGQPASLIMADADHFKQINDTHGHEAGDEALRCMAGVLSAGVREVDLLARLGGEEFAILLPGADAAVAFAVAERIRQGIREKRLRCADGECFCITLSLGVSCCHNASSSLEKMLRCADTALYSAKNAGRNRVELFQGAA
jgi:diguanylate cyclase (GGDEF)-like protein/PAS domain S-box-containing protein